jgi:hypothetical protein
MPLDDSQAIFYLSANPRADAFSRRFFESPGDGIFPNVNRISSSAVRVSLKPGSDDSTGLFFLKVLCALGFAIAL